MKFDITPSPTPVDLTKVTEVLQKSAGLNNGLIDKLGWAWYIIGSIAAALIVAAMAHGSMVGGTQVAFARNRPDKVKKGLAIFGEGALGSVIIASGTFVIVLAAGFVINSFTK